MSSANVVTKNPTPALPLGRPADSSRAVHSVPEVSNPGRCQPERSPYRPPSLNSPRTLSG